MKLLLSLALSLAVLSLSQPYVTAGRPSSSGHTEAAIHEEPQDQTRIPVSTASKVPPLSDTAQVGHCVCVCVCV